MKKTVIVLGVIIILGISAFVIVRACEGSDDETGSASTTAAAYTEPQVDATTEPATSAAEETTKDEPIYQETFYSYTVDKSYLVDKGNYYEATVTVNKKDSNGNVYQDGSRTIMISKSATVSYYYNSSKTSNISIAEYLDMVDYIRIYRCDFSNNVVYSANSDGYVVSFFDGMFG